jgi:hypothetical protein
MVVSGMRDWNAIWNSGGLPGPDWNEPETYIETVQLLEDRGERWVECILQLAERFLVRSRPTEEAHRWEYSVIGDHSGREWGRLSLDVRGCVDDLVTGVLLRVAFNGRRNSAEAEFTALRELLLGERLFDETV